MDCKVRWGEGMTFIAETGSGHLVTMDGAPEGGERNLAPRPMVVVILKKSGQQIAACEVALQAERAATDPKVFTRIHYHFVVRGKNLKRNLVEQAVRLTHEKYCSATAILAKTAEITKDFEIVED
jgi:putative redox protein